VCTGRISSRGGGAASVQAVHTSAAAQARAAVPADASAPAGRA
jgi:hypothetical protein